MKVTLLHGAMVVALSASYQAQAYNCQSYPTGTALRLIHRAL